MLGSNYICEHLQESKRCAILLTYLFTYLLTLLTYLHSQSCGRVRRRWEVREVMWPSHHVYHHNLEPGTEKWRRYRRRAA